MKKITFVSFLIVAFVVTGGVSLKKASAAVTLATNSITEDGALTITGAAASTWSTSAGALSIDSAAALNLGNSTATSASICNSATCDTILIGSNADADTITIGDSTDTTVSITDDNWSVTAAGIATFVNVLVTASATTGVDTGAAGALSLGNVTATSVSVCNSAACDTISVGTNADADTISIGDALDTTTFLGTVNMSGATVRVQVGAGLADAACSSASGRIYHASTSANAMTADKTYICNAAGSAWIALD